jgi:hypothetical protein
MKKKEGSVDDGPVDDISIFSLPHATLALLPRTAAAKVAELATASMVFRARGSNQN